MTSDPDVTLPLTWGIMTAPAALRRCLRTFVWLLAVAACSDSSNGPSRSAEEADLLHRILVAEDSRSSDPRALTAIGEGLTHASPEIRRIAVRAVGRLERVDLVSQIQPLLQDSVAAVRAEAANALAQSVSMGDATAVRASLSDRLAGETDELVLGALAQSLGRVRHGSADDVKASSTAIVGRAGGGTAGSYQNERDVRVAKGLYMLARQPAARQQLSDPALAWLRAALGAPAPAQGDAVSAQRVRTMSFAALAASGRATRDDYERAFADSDPFVRREAFAAIRPLVQLDSAAARALIERGLQDPSGTVRYQALVAWPGTNPADKCSLPQRLARDSNGHVAIQALGMFGTCRGVPAAVRLLDSLVLTLPERPQGDWQVPAYALVALSVVDPKLGGERMQPFVEHANGFVRAYAARAAALTRDTVKLRAFARDPDPNVRTVVLEPLLALTGPAAVPLLVEQLDQDDPQLLMTTAGLLTGSRQTSAVPALLGAFDRLTATGRETSRDARLALLDRVRELGGPAELPRVRPLLQDYDPAVASLAADVIGAWTGARPDPQAVPPQHAPVPTPADLDALEGAVYTVEMADGGSFDLRLRAWDAATNAARFARLAEAGYFDGLTYHRVAPNFVIQGGSPHANEYMGDGAFTRDELGLDGNWRGTVGISTRGHDTGDAQMFVNLVDNVRLDHQYTVFADVDRGMDVVDGVLEGDVIKSVRRTSGR